MKPYPDNIMVVWPILCLIGAAFLCRRRRGWCYFSRTPFQWNLHFSQTTFENFVVEKYDRQGEQDAKSNGGNVNDDRLLHSVGHPDDNDGAGNSQQNQDGFVTQHCAWRSPLIGLTVRPTPHQFKSQNDYDAENEPNPANQEQLVVVRSRLIR